MTSFVTPSLSGFSASQPSLDLVDLCLLSTETLCPCPGKAAPAARQSGRLSGRIWVPWAPPLLACGQGPGSGCTAGSAGQQDHPDHHSGQCRLGEEGGASGEGGEGERIAQLLSVHFLTRRFSPFSCLKFCSLSPQLLRTIIISLGFSFLCRGWKINPKQRME